MILHLISSYDTEEEIVGQDKTKSVCEDDSHATKVFPIK